MSQPFTSIHVKLDAHGFRHIVWTLQPRYDYPQTSVLRLEYNRAGASPSSHTITGTPAGDITISDGAWQVLCDDVSQLCQYIDYQHRNYNKFVNDYYRLVLRVPETGQQYKSAPVHAGKFLSTTDSAQANNLIRLAQKEIQQTGRTGVLLKRKLWGQRCPQCTDFDNQNSVNQHCQVCLGTGIVGGYYKGIPMSILQQSSQQAQSIGLGGYEQVQVLSAKCVAWPWIHLQDVWVDDITNQRYYIKSASVLSKYKHVPLVYALQLQLIQLTDVLHSDYANQILSQDQSTQFVHKNSDWDRDQF